MSHLAKEGIKHLYLQSSKTGEGTYKDPSARYECHSLNPIQLASRISMRLEFFDSFNHT